MHPNAEPIIRVFPRWTNATPRDDLAFVGAPPLWVRQLPQTEVLISVTFTWDRPYAEQLRRQWSNYFARVRIGGPAYDAWGGPFVPGRYLADGYTITTRGCPNRCPFCFVPEREGLLRTLAIQPGRIILDNNLLAAPRWHIERVLDMLAAQKRVIFSGGLEACRLEEWFVQAITAIRFRRLFLAYDRPGQAMAVAEAISLVRYYGHRHDKIGCYLLCGWPGDTLQAAIRRRQQIIDWGGSPYPMYYQDRDSDGRIPGEWHDFVGASWVRPGAVEQCSSTNNTELIAPVEGTPSNIT